MSMLYRCSISLGLDQFDLLQIIRSAPYRYKVYSIPKRSGGSRIIAQPAVELKMIQRWLIEEELDSLPVHKCATAYKAGGSIKKNAEPHRKNRYLLKLDFKDFFPSLKPEHFVAHVNKHLANKYTSDELVYLSRLLFYAPKGRRNDLRLSVGAPSSPFISNTLMYDFDRAIYEHCRNSDLRYTRYADDLTFSAAVPNLMGGLIATVRETLNQCPYPALRINHQKTVHTSMKHRRKITGVIISNDGSLSLGRERKRLISAMIHSYLMGRLNSEEANKLKGFISYANDIEPSFVASMVKKYSASVINDIKNI